MKLIAIDSSTQACSVAILQGDEVIERWQLAPREHTRMLLPMVEQVLAESGLSLLQLDAIAFACGPGSFTGLRVCTSVVQGLAYGADLPVVPVSTLASLAQVMLERCELPAQAVVLAALDARMDEVYWSLYQSLNGLAEPLCAERLCAPEQVITETQHKLFGAGPGFVYAERFPCAEEFVLIDKELLPRASAVARLGAAAFAAGNYCRSDQAAPTYLREEISWKKTALQGPA
jgi:tRNA threonylcarbamoyladenosine biosynthesis protein TsaB